jgi:hypothetical protein
LKYFFIFPQPVHFQQAKQLENTMNAVELKDLQVGQTYYIHQVKDEATHSAVSLKYKAVCNADYSQPGGWYEFGFDTLKGINTADIDGGLGISIDEDRWGLYKFYLCKSDDILERVANYALQGILGDSSFDAM